jgi:hypothetical protein
LIFIALVVLAVAASLVIAAKFQEQAAQWARSEIERIAEAIADARRRYGEAVQAVTVANCGPVPDLQVVAPTCD